MQSWNYLTFSELMKHDKKRAFEYRKETLGDEIPEEYRDKPTVSISKEEIKEKLKSA
mgnify:CR=1 FL=1